MTDDLTPGPTPPSSFPDADAEGAAPAGAASRFGPASALPSQPGPSTAGALIRDAREAQGIDLASLAAMLKVPLRRLEALESDRHEELQGPTFERALAQAACRVLKIDPKPVLALLPQHERNTLERVSEGINTPFRDGQGGGGFELPAGTRPVVIFVAILILAALALLFVPAGWLTRLKAEFTSSPAASAPAESASASAAPLPPPAASTAAAVELPVASAAAPVASAAGPSASVAVAAAPAASAPLRASAPASAAAGQGVDEVLAHQAGAPSIPLQVIATADSWVEVVDAQGHTLLSRTVVAGESVGLDGALPMHVKIGNAGGTRLKLRGDNVDLTPWTRDNVARLEVK
jgi:cytoskeleton protein RodZ